MPDRRNLRRRRDDHHPLWDTVHVLVSTLAICAGICGILWVTATNFDSTELQTVMGSGLIIGVREAVRQFWNV